jgi:hypothetical protein
MSDDSGDKNADNSDNSDNSVGDLQGFIDAADAERPRLAQLIEAMTDATFTRAFTLLDLESRRRNLQTRVQDMDESSFRALVNRHLKDPNEGIS